MYGNEHHSILSCRDVFMMKSLRLSYIVSGHEDAPVHRFLCHPIALKFILKPSFIMLSSFSRRSLSRGTTGSLGSQLLSRLFPETEGSRGRRGAYDTTGWPKPKPPPKRVACSPITVTFASEDKSSSGVYANTLKSVLNYPTGHRDSSHGSRFSSRPSLRDSIHRPFVASENELSR